MPIRSYRIPLRVVFYQEDGRWVAHCLEFDLCGDGSTQPEALVSLTRAIEIQVEAANDFRNLRNLFQPADSEYHQMFAAGKDIVMGEIHLQVNHLTIEGTSSREYVDDYQDCDSNLVTA